MTDTLHSGDDRSQDPQQQPTGADAMPVPDKQDVVTVAPPTGKHLEENPAAENPILNPDAAE